MRPGVAADEVRDDVIVEIRGHGELAAVERGIAEPVHAGARLDLQRDEIAPGARDDDARRDDLAILRRASAGRRPAEVCS